jgi:hypothetical protein
MVTRLSIALLSSLIALGAFAPPGHSASQMTLGIVDSTFISGDAAVRATWLDRTRDSGARLVRLPVSWAGIAQRPPAAPTDPNDPAYVWGSLDAAVADASARGFRILITVSKAPAWAEGPHRAQSADAGTWKPGPRAVGQFMQAIATRYPNVRAWQLWNEPNLVRYLAPQWERSRGRFVPAAPAHYRRMLNAAYSGIRAANRRNRLVTAGTAPYGDPQPGGRRIMPVRFWREVVRGKVRFDVLAHHPYGVAGPFRKALNRDDAALPDIGKLDRVVRSAARRGRVLPRGRKPVWVTEVSWDSSPPDPQGVPAERHARWTTEALYVLWRQRVQAVAWFQIVDQAAEPSFAATSQSGLFMRDGTAKPARDAFAFPFLARPASRGRLRLWGLAPASGTAQVERRNADGTWVAVAQIGARSGRIFRRSLTARRPVTLRARIGERSSIPYYLR